ncbi:MAG: T9SS type A sorting domain-containing protein [Flavobacteriales bacterium]|nr:T9SS type A sorting domain-containing protein [Flavobacteriales bacterium]
MAQQWSFFQPGWKYNYFTSDTGAVSAQVFITHTDTLGAEFYEHQFNRIAEYCDTCVPDSVVTDLPQFVQRSATVRDSVWLLHDPDSLVFLPYADLGSIWVMDTAASINAEVTAVDTLVQFGLIDQKTITCTNGDVWVISREWGMMRMNDLELYGVHGPDVGFLVPDIHQMYPFQAGDIMELFIGGGGAHYNWWYPYGSTYRRRKYTMISRTDTGDDVLYDTWAVWTITTTTPATSSSTNTNHYSGSNNMQWETSITELPYRDLLSSYPGELIMSEHQITPGSPHFICVAKHRIDSLGRYCKECDLKSYPYCNLWDHVSYVEGKGIDKYSWNCAAQGEVYQLVGSVISGDTSGTISSDSYLLSVQEQTMSEIQVYPNPVQDLLQIEGIGHGEVTLVLFDAQGRSVLERSVNGPTYVLDVGSFEAGVYSIIIRGKSDGVPVKVFIFH